MTDDDKRRTVRLNVRLNADSMARLDELSERLGVPASTIGAVAIGEYVSKKMLEKEAFIAAVNAAEGAVKQMTDMFMNPEKLQSLVASFEGADSLRLEKD